MEIIALVVIGIFIWSRWHSANVANERHEQSIKALGLILNDIKEIKSGVTNSEDRGLNPNLFDITPEIAGIVEKKVKEIVELQKNIENLEKQIKILRTSLDT